MEALGAIASVIAAITAVIALWRTRNLPKLEQSVHHTQNELNKLLLRKEKADAIAAECADFSARFVKIGSSKWRLMIANKGKAPAQNVDVDFPDSNIILGAEDKFPMAVMEPGDSVELVAAIAMGDPPKIQVKISWKDGMQGETDKLLTPTT
jgi:uncharacterized cupredoxin-like copper-binding protein